MRERGLGLHFQELFRVEEGCSGECGIVKQQDEFTSVLRDVLETGKVYLELLASRDNYPCA